MAKSIAETLADPTIQQQNFTGGCLCGAIRYECLSKPAFAYYCHCTDCQKASGTTFHTGLYLSVDSLKFHSGTPKEYKKLADSGNSIIRYFCAECGSQLYSMSSASAEYLSLKVGSLDDPSWVTPTIEIWTDSAVPCAHIQEGLSQFPKSPRSQ